MKRTHSLHAMKHYEVSFPLSAYVRVNADVWASDETSAAVMARASITRKMPHLAQELQDLEPEVKQAAQVDDFPGGLWERNFS